MSARLRGPAAITGPAQVEIEVGSDNGDTAPRAAKQEILVPRNWRPRESNSLRGFADLVLPSGLIIRDVMLHEFARGRWVALPGKVQVMADGSARVDAKTGKRLYTPIIEFRDRETTERFQAAALAAFGRLRGRPL